MQTQPTSSAKIVGQPSRTQAELRALGDKHEPGSMMAELYCNAEVQLRKQNKNTKKNAAEIANTETDSQRLLHELQVHQVELEMQNAELQEARNRLEVLLEKYTDLYDFSPVGYFTLAASGIIQQVNLTGAHLVRVERSRLVGQSFGTLVPPAQRPAFNSFLREVFNDQTNRFIDIGLLSQGQSLRVIRIRAKRSPAGEECRVVVVDITELNREMNKVRVSETRYRRLFEAAHDGVLLLDAETRKITDANPFMVQLLGYSHAQLVGKEMFEIGLLKDKAASREMFQKLKWQPEVRYEDLPLETKNGRHQQVEVVANQYQENGRAVIQCNLRDITARKLAEQALCASEERFRAAVGIVTSLIWTNSAEGLMAGEQPGWGNFTGQTQKEYQDYGWVKAVHPEDAQPTVAAWRRAVAKKSLFAFEHRVRRHDGAWRLCSVCAVPLLGSGGVIREWVGVHTDITERKAAQEAQRRIEVLAASNGKLETEIIRRQAVETALQKSERHERQLRELAQRMQQELRQLSQEILQTQEEERKRISRELHDVIAQTLTGVNLRLASLKTNSGQSRAAFERNLAHTQKIISQSVAVVHEFARELRPAMLDDLGLIPALHSYLKNFTAQHGVRTYLRAFAGVEKIPVAQCTVLFRVAQEALTNVNRHAKASRVEVTIKKMLRGICMKINDDGKSFSVEGVLNTKGRKRLGLLGMRERLEMLGGSFEIESAPGQGTTVIAQIPFGKIRGLAKSVKK